MLEWTVLTYQIPPLERVRRVARAAALKSSIPNPCTALWPPRIGYDQGRECRKQRLVVRLRSSVAHHHQCPSLLLISGRSLATSNTGQVDGIFRELYAIMQQLQCLVLGLNK